MNKKNQSLFPDFICNGILPDLTFDPAMCFLVSDENMLSLFYLRNKKRMSKTKEGLEAYYTLKTKYPEFLNDRDPCQPWFTQASDTV